VFQLNPISYAFETLHTFGTVRCNADLIVDSQGRLYGAIKTGSDTFRKFEIFRVTP
jgi:hypothetical protein